MSWVLNPTALVFTAGARGLYYRMRGLMEPVTVATFNEPEEAEPVRQRLTDVGIFAEVHDERKLQKYLFLSRPLAGIRLRVDKKDHSRAESLLNEWDKTTGILRDAIRCPECGSSRIEYPQFSRHFAWGAVAAVCAALGFFGRKLFCKHCQYTWPTEVKVEAKRDILGWPQAPTPGTSQKRQ